MKSILPAYLALMSLCAFALCGVDKGRAKKGAWRIPEGTLLLTAALGGSLGLLLGMRLGEGSGCPVFFRVLEAACAAMNDMATFAEAEIQDDYLDPIRAGDSFTVENA